MSFNPALDERIFKREAADAATSAPGGAGTRTPPISDGPVSPWKGYRAMTVGGVARATTVLFAILLATAAFGWSQVTETSATQVQVPGWIFLPLIGALGLAVATIFRPKWAPVTAPLYAAFEGVLLGAISKVFELRYDGIVLQAVGLTLAVFALVLVAFATGLIKVTPRLRMGIMVATGAVAIVYLVGFVARLFGGSVGFIDDPSLVGIGFSLVVVGIAASNLLLDFDFVQRNVDAAAPKRMEWYSAFGLVLTLVWLYLELLRLLSKLRR